MKTSNMIFDINAKDGIGVRANIIAPDFDQMYTQQFRGESGEPVQTLVMDILTYCLQGLRELEKQDPGEYKGRYTFIVPDTVAPRLFQAQGLVNAKQNLLNKMYLPWMDRYTSKEGVNLWYNALANLSKELEYFMDKDNGWSINIVNARTLYRYEVLPVDKDDPNIVMTPGMKVSFYNSQDNANGLYVRDMSFVNGDFTLQETSTRDREGNVHKRYFIPHMITVEDSENGARYAISTIDYQQLSAEEQAHIQPVTDSSRYIITAMNLRVENAKQLPQSKVFRNFKVVQVSGEQLF